MCVKCGRVVRVSWVHIMNSDKVWCVWVHAALMGDVAAEPTYSVEAVFSSLVLLFRLDRSFLKEHKNQRASALRSASLRHSDATVFGT